jgi:hypothetical protein
VIVGHRRPSDQRNATTNLNVGWYDPTSLRRLGLYCGTVRIEQTTHGPGEWTRVGRTSRFRKLGIECSCQCTCGCNIFAPLMVQVSTELDNLAQQGLLLKRACEASSLLYLPSESPSCFVRELYILGDIAMSTPSTTSNHCGRRFSLGVRASVLQRGS